MERRPAKPGGNKVQSRCLVYQSLTRRYFQHLKRNDCQYKALILFLDTCLNTHSCRCTHKNAYTTIGLPRSFKRMTKTHTSTLISFRTSKVAVSKQKNSNRAQKCRWPARPGSRCETVSGLND